MSRRAKIGIALACLAVVVGVTAGVSRKALEPPALAPSTGGVESAKSRAPAFTHVVVVVFENQEYQKVIGDPAAPTFNGLARRYALLTNSYAVTHPSLPNYLALVSGSTQGITDSCEACVANASSLVDSLEQARLGWKTYAEGLPSPGFTKYLAGKYAKKHNPFLYFRSVLENPNRLARVVPYDQLAVDLGRGELPQFSLVVPDLCNSMHDCSVATGDAWLKGFVGQLLENPQMKGGVIFITFDEGTSNRQGGGHISTIVAGSTVASGVQSAQPVTHYSVLRTIEDAWGLPRLGESANAKPITGIWRESP
jgi:hypothetical protein